MTTEKQYDCHGKTYAKVSDEIENWVLFNYRNRPLQIITGNSLKMRATVEKVLKEHKIGHVIPSYNLGMIIIN